MMRQLSIRPESAFISLYLLTDRFPMATKLPESNTVKNCVAELAKSSGVCGDRPRSLVEFGDHHCLFPRSLRDFEVPDLTRHCMDFHTETDSQRLTIAAGRSRRVLGPCGTLSFF